MNDIFVGRLDEITDSLKLLGTAMALLPNLRILDLSNNAISINGGKSLQHFLSTTKSLRELYISNGGHGIEGTTLMA